MKDRTFELVRTSPPRLRVLENGQAVQELTVPPDQARLIGGKLLVLGSLAEIQDPRLAYDEEVLAETIRQIWPKGGTDDRQA